MKKVIIIGIVVVLIGAGVYIWVIPNFFKPSYTELNKLPSTTLALPPESPPTTGTNTQEFIEKATAVFPTKEMLDAGKTASTILKTMDYQAAQNLLPQISQCDPAFAEMQSAVDAELNVAPEDFRPERKIPNYSAAQTMGKLLVVKGMGMEGQRKLDDAVTSYLLAVQFGSVFAGKNTSIIQKLIGLTIERTAYKPLKEFTIKHPDDIHDLKRIISALENADQKRIPLSDPFLSEKKTMLYLIQHYSQYTDYIQGSPKLTEKERHQIQGELEKFYSFNIQSFELSYPQFVNEKRQSKLTEMLKEGHPVTRIVFPNFSACLVRELYTVTDNHLIRVMAAVQLYHNDKKVYPNTLAELAPNYLTTVPKDYFSDSDFVYGLVSQTYYLYSVGPDMQDNQERPVYDPTNGTISSGDVIGR